MDGNIEAAKAKAVHLSTGQAYNKTAVYNPSSSQRANKDLVLLHKPVIHVSE